MDRGQNLSMMMSMSGASGTAAQGIGAQPESRRIHPKAGVRLLNNTLYRSDASNDFNDGIVINAGCADTVARNNLLSAPDVTGPVALIADSGTGTTATNNQVIDNPNFTDPDNADPLSRDFTLQTGSLAINQGSTVEVLDDYADLRRTGLIYDLGAHEHGAPQSQDSGGNDSGGGSSGGSGGCFVMTLKQPCGVR